LEIYLLVILEQQVMLIHLATVIYMFGQGLVLFPILLLAVVVVVAQITVVVVVAVGIQLLLIIL
jgi:hypothetical protein